MTAASLPFLLPPGRPGGRPSPGYPSLNRERVPKQIQTAASIELQDGQQANYGRTPGVNYMRLGRTLFREPCQAKRIS